MLNRYPLLVWNVLNAPARSLGRGGLPLLLFPLLAALAAPAQNLSFERLSSESGLSQNMINCLLQDRKGFLWVGTQDGLNRFDGYRFATYRQDPYDSTSISGNDVESIVEDRQGRLWVTAEGQGLNLFDREREVFLRTPAMSKLEGELWEDRYGNLWLGYHFRGLAKIELPPGAKGLEGLKIQLFQADSTRASALASTNAKPPVWDAAGRGFVGSFDKKIQRIYFDSLRKTFRFDSRFDDVPDPVFRQALLQAAPFNYLLAQGRDHKVWLALNDAVLCWDARTGKCDRFPVPPYQFRNATETGLYRIYGLLEDRKNRVWLDGYNKTFLLDANTRQISLVSPHADDPAHPLFYGVTSFLEDRGGLFWLGTRGNGLMKVNENASRFKAPVHAPGLWQGQSIRTMHKTTDGRIWIATMHGGVFWLDPARSGFSWQLKEFVPGWQLPGEPGTSIGAPLSFFQDKSGVLWVGSESKLLLKVTGWQQDAPRIELAKDLRGASHPHYPAKIIGDAGGKALWLVCPGSLLHFDPATGAAEEFPFFGGDASRIENNLFPTGLQDRQGSIWVGLKEGLWRFDPKAKTFQKFRNDPSNPRSLSNDLVKCIAEDPGEPERYLWVGTGGGGLNRFDLQNGTFEHFTEKDGLPDRVIYGMLPDQAGNMWLSTNKGISRFDPKRRTFRNFDHRDGLQDLEFNTAAYCRAFDGQLFFGGIKGLNAFYPERMAQANAHAPIVAFTDFKISNKSVSVKDLGSVLTATISEVREIRLPWDAKSLTFEFAALDFSDPGKNQFSWKMEGFDPGWQPATAARSATYTNLDPGTYTFRVRASNNDGVWNEQGASVKIVVLPPWWRTWWAYLSYGLAVFGLFWFFRKKELKEQALKHSLELERVESEKLKEVDQLKTRFFANISHEFRTPLTLMLGQVDSALSRVEDLRLKGRLSMASENGKRLLQLINQLLDLAKLESGKMQLRVAQGDLVQFLKYNFYAFESLAEKKRIRLDFKSETEALDAFFEKEKMGKVLFNLLSNAMKFTPDGGSVAMRVATKAPQENFPEGWVEIAVSDTGVGIPEDRLPFIFDRFFQVDSSSTREWEGTGIGLSLVKEFVELHHGEVAVASEHGAGTCFTLRLPLGSGVFQADKIEEGQGHSASDFSQDDLSAVLPFSTARAGKAKTSARASGPLAHLLVVEDNPDMRSYLCDHLFEAGYSVSIAVNGEEGLAAARELLPDLIITDVMMPRMDGHELSRRLRSDERTSHVPIIMLTAKAGEEDKIEGLETGVDDYLTKPFSEKELLLRVRNLVEKRRLLRQRFSTAIVIRPAEVSAAPLDQVFLQKVIETIEARLGDEQFGVEPLSEAVNMSATHLNRKLNALIDQPAGNLIRSMRLQRAADLLEKNAGTVSEIAWQVGFAEAAHFTRSFKQQFGASPSAWQKNKAAKA